MSRYYMDKFFITVTSYAMGTEIHGCYREAILKLTHDQAPCYITKGAAPWTRASVHPLPS